MDRRHFIRLAAGGAAAGASAIASGARAPKRRPNFIIFLADDLGYGDLGCFDHPVIQTPNLDRFAGEGVRLTSCYSACAVCSPSRSAIQTGRTPHRNGVFTWIPADSDIHLRESEITIASLLSDAGCATCHVGKWHLNGKFNSSEQPQPSEHGYDHWLATQNNAAPSHKNPVNFVRNGEEVGPLEGFSATLIAEEATRWLESEWDGEQPFFLTIWTHEPHAPIESDPRFMGLYPGIDDEGQVQHHANVTQIDHSFGMVMDALERQGLTDDTFVMFTSDNGPAGDGKKGRARGSAGPLRGRKGSLYEGGIRVPGIVRWPGNITPGTQSDEPVIGSDILTTLCAITGITPPQDRPIDGANMLPALSGRRVRRDIPLYWRWEGTGGPKLALRQGDWKLLSALDYTGLALYNLRDDIGETTNLADASPKRLNAMKRTLTDLNEEVQAEGPDWWMGYYPRQQKTGPIPEGKDETGAFDVVQGATVREHDLGYELEAEAEGLALIELGQPITNRVVFRAKYQSTNAPDAGVKNACLVFGSSAKNDALIHCGSLIGMQAHAIFQGTFANNARGAKLVTEYDKGKLFDVTVAVDLKAGTVTMEVDGEVIEAKLPTDLREIRHYGYYVKGTTSAFSEISVERD